MKSKIAISILVAGFISTLVMAQNEMPVGIKLEKPKVTQPAKKAKAPVAQVAPDAQVDAPAIAVAPAVKDTPAPVVGPNPIVDLPLFIENPVIEPVKTVEAEAKPEVLEVKTVIGDKREWAEYTLTDKDAPRKGDNWNIVMLGDQHLATEVKLTNEEGKKIGGDLLNLLGRASIMQGMPVWNSENYTYMIGNAKPVQALLETQFVEKELRNRIRLQTTDDLVLVVVNKEVDGEYYLVNRINTSKISNEGLARKAAPAGRPQMGALGQMPGSGARMGSPPNVAGRPGNTPVPAITVPGVPNLSVASCPPGKVWAGPYTNEKGQYVPGRCVDAPAGK